MDHLNQAKSGLSEKLIELIKFTRDCQRESHKCDDLEGVVDGDLKSEFKSIKEQNIRTREELKLLDLDRTKILLKVSEIKNICKELNFEN